MYNKNIKLFIAILIIAYAGYQFYEGYIGNGIMYLFLSSIFIFLYFKNEFILLSFVSNYIVIIYHPKYAGIFVLSRIDGKANADYITDENNRSDLRPFGKRLFLNENT